MKKAIYIVIILISAFLGRLFVLLNFDVANMCSMSKSEVIIFTIPSLVLLCYLLYMRYKQKTKWVKFSAEQKMLLTAALTLFVEITINGATIVILDKEVALMLFLFGMTLPFTIGLTILVAFLWILKEPINQQSKENL